MILRTLSSRGIATGMAAAFLVELLMLTWLRGSFGYFASPVVFFAASLAMGMLGIALALSAGDRPRRLETRYISAVLVLFALLTASAFFAASQIFGAIPIDAAVSDILPQIQTMVQRFLRGEMPYQPIPFDGYVMVPTYQPLQWLPAVPAEFFGFDYRFMPLAVFTVAYAGYVRWVVTEADNAALRMALTPLPYLVMASLMQTAPGVFGHTVEPLVAGYYLLLCLGTIRLNTLSIAVGLSLCLCSRYAVVLWVPLPLLVLWLEKGRRDVVKLVAVMVAVVVVVELPFLLQDPLLTLKGYASHRDAALWEWQGQSWQPPGGLPYQLFRGIGFASWFYTFWEGALGAKLHAVRSVHLLLSVGVVAGMAWWFVRARARLNARVFLLASFKVYLSIFYHFIHIPYDYLFMVPMMVSVVLLAESLMVSSRAGSVRLAAGIDAPAPSRPYGA